MVKRQLTPSSNKNKTKRANALKLFMSSPTITYQEIAQLTGISLPVVRGWHEHDNWSLYRSLYYSNDEQNLLQTIVETELQVIITELQCFATLSTRLPVIAKSVKTVDDMVRLREQIETMTNRIRASKRVIGALQLGSRKNKFDSDDVGRVGGTVQSYVRLGRRYTHVLKKAKRLIGRLPDDVELLGSDSINLGTLHKEPKQSIGEQLKKEKAERKYYRGF